MTSLLQLRWIFCRKGMLILNPNRMNTEMNKVPTLLPCLRDKLSHLFSLFMPNLKRFDNQKPPIQSPFPTQPPPHIYSPWFTCIHHDYPQAVLIWILELPSCLLHSIGINLVWNSGGKKPTPSYTPSVEILSPSAPSAGRSSNLCTSCATNRNNSLWARTSPGQTRLPVEVSNCYNNRIKKWRLVSLFNNHVI